MTDKMKLSILFGIILLVTLVQIFVPKPTEASTPHDTTDHLRLRVIANSDDELDQLIKRVAVFATTDFMNANEEGHTFSFLVQHLTDIQQAVHEVLSQMGHETTVEVSIGYHYFPATSGYYPSLVVRLGEGVGENWWCFINPGVCVVPTEAEIGINEDKVYLTSQVQANMVTRTFDFFTGLFSTNEHLTVNEGEINWFLFDDER